MENEHSLKPMVSLPTSYQRFKTMT